MTHIVVGFLVGFAVTSDIIGVIVYKKFGRLYNK